MSADENNSPFSPLSSPSPPFSQKRESEDIRGGRIGSSESFFYERFEKKPFFLQATTWGVVIVAIIITIAYVAWFRAPREFPPDSLFTVAEGATLYTTATRLAEQGIIRSPFWFTAVSVVLGGTRGLKAGDYLFGEPLSVLQIAWRLNRSAYALLPVSVTIPEGFNNREVAARLAERLMRFDTEQFTRAAEGKEGSLFPDTYRFLPNEKPERIIAEMEANFTRRISSLEQDIAAFGRPEREVIIMASLLEEEARTEETRRKVAGILWKRLDNKMPLQVDAVFPYIFGGKPYDLTDSDLFVDSPYNTYKYLGLPPTPITNPGLDSIRAAITPITTPYWYYLSDREGNMHYAVTHDEHLLNRVRYLGK